MEEQKQLKRKVSEVDVAAEPAKIAKEASTAPNWRKVELKKVNARFQASKSQFGGSSGYFNYENANTPFSFTTPWCIVAHDPSVWDEAKNAKFGKKEADGKIKPLDPNRKTDKWSLGFEVTEPFLTFLDVDVKRAIAELIYPKRNEIWRDGSKRAATSPDQLMMSFEVIVKYDEKSGVSVFNFDIKSDRDAEAIPVEVIDYETKLAVDPKLIGKGTEACAVVSFDSSYMNKSIKLYATPKTIYVRNIVAPRGSSTLKPEFDE